MAPASNEEQFKFLISCIRYSNNGKVDFGQVAKECSIVSKGAAAKRYERMMRAHGIASNAATIKPSNTARNANSKPDRTASGSLSTNARKRKADQFVEDPNPADDEEDFGSSTNGNFKTETGQERRGTHIKRQMHVKEEHVVESKSMVNTTSSTHGGSQLSFEDANELLRFYPDSPSGGSQDREGSPGGDGFFEAVDYPTPGHSNSNSNGFATGPTPYAQLQPSQSPSNYGRVSPHPSGYGMRSPHPHSYRNGYENGASGYGTPSSGMGIGMGMSSMTSSPVQQMGYQASSYRSDTKGRQESPLLVE